MGNEAGTINQSITRKNGKLVLTVPLLDFPDELRAMPQITKEIICLKRVKERSRWLLAERLWTLSNLFNEKPEEFKKLTGFDTFRQYINAPEENDGEDRYGIDLAESTVYTYINLHQSYKVDIQLPDEAQDYLEELDYNKLKYIRKEITTDNWKEKFQEVKEAQRGEVFDKHRKKPKDKSSENGSGPGKDEATKDEGRSIRVEPCKHEHNEYLVRCNDCGWREGMTREEMLKKLLAPYTKGEGFRLVNMTCRGGKE